MKLSKSSMAFVFVLVILAFFVCSTVWATNHSGAPTRKSQPIATKIAVIPLEIPAKSSMELFIDVMPEKTCDIIAIDFKLFGIFDIRLPIFGAKSHGFVLNNSSSRPFSFAVEVSGVGLLQAQTNGRFAGAYLVIDGEIYPLPTFPTIP